MREIAGDLREGLGPAASKVPTRELPNFAVKIAARFDPSPRAITVSPGRKNKHSIAKARRVLGWKPRPAAVTVVGCAESLIEQGVLQNA
jgi:nucleoside-diphosphate-sugar epimerase